MNVQRISKTNFRSRTKRPGVFTLQAALKAVGVYDGAIDGDFYTGTKYAVCAFQARCGLDNDGVVGSATSTPLLSEAREAGFVADLKWRIREVICFFELSNSRLAYGRATVIADGAGANYGFVQANRLGSCARILKIGGELALRKQYLNGDKMKIDPDVRDWFGSLAGIKTQNLYFDKVVWKIARRIREDFPDMGEEICDERLMMMLVDTVVQNGTLYSPKRKPFWRTTDGSTSPKLVELVVGKRWDDYLGNFIPYQALKGIWDQVNKQTDNNREETNKQVIQQLWHRIPDNQSRLIMLAQYRARTSWEKYWDDVEDRRMFDALGVGRVHGTKLNLAKDFGVGVDHPEVEDRNTSQEQFFKDFAQDIIEAAE